MTSLRGTVTRVDTSGRPWVEVTTLGVGQEFGPCDRILIDNATAPAAGDRVLLAEVVPGDLVVVGVLPAGVPGGKPGGPDSGYVDGYVDTYDDGTTPPPPPPPPPPPGGDTYADSYADVYGNTAAPSSTYDTATYDNGVYADETSVAASPYDTAIYDTGAYA